MSCIYIYQVTDTDAEGDTGGEVEGDEGGVAGGAQVQWKE